MFKRRTQTKELMDDFSLADNDLRKNLDELTFYNQWLGGRRALLHALDKVSERYHDEFSNRKIFLADLACGGGDLLEAINAWAVRKKLDMELIGIDANPFMIKYAQEKFDKCQYQVADILATDLFKNTIDVASLNSVCHHFSDEELIKLLEKLKQVRMAIIINELRRSALAYYLIKGLTRLVNFSYYAKNDAPLSVLKAFRKQELINILKLAGITSYEIRKTWAFRWQIIIWRK